MTLLRTGLLLLLVGLSGNLLADNYKTLSDRVRPQVSSEKIEVTAIFSYTCPYCYQLEPQLQTWSESLPDDVEVVHLPAAFNAQWEHLARAYYIMDALDMTDQVHMALFDRIHQENANLGSQRALRNFFADFGVDGKKFDELYSSFGVNSQVKQDTARLRNYKVTGVPALVIDGQYVVDGNSAGSLGNMLTVADDLITQVRANR